MSWSPDLPILLLSQPLPSEVVAKSAVKPLLFPNVALEVAAPMTLLQQCHVSNGSWIEIQNASTNSFVTAFARIYGLDETHHPRFAVQNQSAVLLSPLLFFHLEFDLNASMVAGDLTSCRVRFRKAGAAPLAPIIQSAEQSDESLWDEAPAPAAAAASHGSDNAADLPVPTAKWVKLSRVQSAGSSGHADYSSALCQCFRQEQVLRMGQVLHVPLNLVPEAMSLSPLDSPQSFCWTPTGSPCCLSLSRGCQSMCVCVAVLWPCRSPTQCSSSR